MRMAMRRVRVRGNVIMMRVIVRMIMIVGMIMIVRMAVMMMDVMMMIVGVRVAGSTQTFIQHPGADGDNRYTRDSA